MLDHLRFWFARGIDGFRIDVLWMIAKDDAPWLDGPITSAPHGFGGDPRGALEHGDGPDMEARLAELRDVADASPERVLIGEVYMEPARLVRYYGRDGRGAHLPFNFALITLAWDAGTIAAAVAAYEAALPRGRMAQLGARQPRPVADRDARRAPRRRAWPRCSCSRCAGRRPVQRRRARAARRARVRARVVDVAGRDPERSPMPWTRAGPRRPGFSTGEPWLPMVDDAAAWSVEAQRADDRSMLALLPAAAGPAARGARAPRRGLAAPRHPESWRTTARRRVCLPGRAQPLPDPVSVPLDGAWIVALSTHLDRDDEAATGAIGLRADEGLVLRASG